FCDAVRDSGLPKLLLSGLSRDEAETVRRALLVSGADVIVTPSKTGSGPSSIAQAYREMLDLFVPNETAVRLLDDLDDDERSGVRKFVGRPPSIAQVRRWLQIREAL